MRSSLNDSKLLLASKTSLSLVVIKHSLMLKRTERHQSSLMNIRVNISLRKPGSSSKNVCRGHCLSFQFPFISGICEETLSTQSSQGLGVGGKGNVIA